MTSEIKLPDEPTLNLTAEEAAGRAALLTVYAYDVAVDLTQPSKDHFPVTTIVRFAAQAGATTFIDAITDGISAITLNGRDLSPHQVSDGTRILLENLQEDNELTVEADYRFMNTGEGMHRFVDPEDGETYLYTQFEVPDARRVFACFDQPDLKAPFTFTVQAPSGWEVVSNSPVASKNHSEENTTTWKFKQTPVISTYITAIVAGPYQGIYDQLVSSDGRTIELGLFARSSMISHVDHEELFTLTKQGFEVFEKHYGWPYPFAKYDQLFVPEFNAGAMENAGAVTFLEDYVFKSTPNEALVERRAITVLHELAHMWFGNLVTMRWWNDLWLNESFAEFMSHVAAAENTEFGRAWTTFAAVEKNWAYRQDQLSTTHPVVAEISDLEDVQVNFDGITYAKGAAVLRQLVAWVGQDNFMAGIRTYLRKHAWKNTILSDLFTELNASSGRDLQSWAEAWLDTAGVNTLIVKCEVDADSSIQDFTITQAADAEYPTIRSHRIGIGLYSAEGSKVVRQDYFEIDIDSETTAVTDLIGQRHPGLIVVNDQDLTYAKVKFDRTSSAFIQEHLSAIEDSLTRAVIWSALWNEVRDGDRNPREFLDLVLRHSLAEDHPSLLSTILKQLITTLDHYIPNNAVSQVQGEVAEKLLKLFEQANPGSDTQLQFLETFLRVATTPRQLETLKQFVAGAKTPDGRVFEQDLRWKALTTLAAHDQVSENDLRGEAENDQTASGQLSLATASAALPGQTRKRDIWDQILADETSNSKMRALTQGFHRSAQPQELHEFVADYFGIINTVWETRTSHEVAETRIRGLFPITQKSPEVLEAAERVLSEHSATAPALARMVAEMRDDLQRALNVQQAFN